MTTIAEHQSQPVMVDRDDLLAVAKGWSHEDDWGVPVISIETLGLLAGVLLDGVDPYVLAKHAGHVGSNCCPLRKCETSPAYCKGFHTAGDHVR